MFFSVAVSGAAEEKMDAFLKGPGNKAPAKNPAGTDNPPAKKDNPPAKKDNPPAKKDKPPAKKDNPPAKKHIPWVEK